jgi:hypothetical protein
MGTKFVSDYGSPIADIIRSFGIEVHLYADDTQLYLAFKPSVTESLALETLQYCICYVRAWMASNFLKLNDDKTEFLIIGSSNQLKKVTTTGLKVGTVDVSPSASARNIGAHFDTTLKLDKHVNAICCAAWSQIRNIGKIRKYLSDEHTATLIHAFVTTKLDHNNSLLYGCSKQLISKLQKIQNTAAKLVTKKKKFDHVTPILRELHWLPVIHRINYKIALLVYKCLNDQGPAYLKDLLHFYKPSRSLRSAKSLLLTVPRVKLTYGMRSFSYAAPTIWNDLPINIRSAKTTDAFKSQLKSYYFKTAF